jgi:hypothetical protein
MKHLKKFKHHRKRRKTILNQPPSGISPVYTWNPLYNSESPAPANNSIPISQIN